MPLPRKEIPLRRSALGSHRESTMRVNDDEAERREARRRTMLQEQSCPRASSVKESFENNKTIRKCEELYNVNKLRLLKRPRVMSTQDHIAGGGGNTAAQAAKKRSQPLIFGECTESLFQSVDANTELRKANSQKHWDARKLVLPTRYQIDADYFYKYDYAPGIKVSRRFGVPHDMDRDERTTNDAGHVAELYDYDDVDRDPSQATQAIVPFARRAEVIDMENLKDSCCLLIKEQLLNSAILAHRRAKEEHCAKGTTTFKEVYDKLPVKLTTKIEDSVSPAAAFFAVLHLANDMGLRLIPQKDNENFTIRQLTD